MSGSPGDISGQLGSPRNWRWWSTLHAAGWLTRLAVCILGSLSPNLAHGQLAVRGETIYTMSGPPVTRGVILIRDGKITAIGQSSEIQIPDEFQVMEGQVVTPGLIDAHATVGVSGILNYSHDQDQLEHAEPIQPELRALDAYNPLDPLVDWVRGFGVTTVHTGHAPGELISGQTCIVKTTGRTVDAALVSPARALAVTLSELARKSDTKSPGTRGKMMSMLRQDFVRAREYLNKIQAAADDAELEPPPRDLRLEALGQVLKGELALMVTADRAQDIVNALRLKREFNITLWLDSAAEAYLLIDAIKDAEVPVILHPSMARAVGEKENLSFETAAKLTRAGIPVAIPSGYESYVPKTRIVLFEAAIAAANGLTFEEALATITIQPARILGIDDRVGSLNLGKDGDLAIYNGDPFEYTTQCTAVVIQGVPVSHEAR